MVGEVDGLGDGVVGVALEGRLQLDVPLGGDVVGGGEHAAPALGHVVDVARRALVGDALHERLGVEALAPRDLFEVGVDLEHLVVVEHLAAHVAQGEQRLDAAGAAGDDGDGAGRGDRGDGRVAQARTAFDVEDGALEVGKHAALVGELDRGGPRLGVHELHELAGQPHRLVGVVGDAEPEEQVGEAHDAQADLAVAAAHFGDLRQRVVVDVDDVVQEAHGRLDDAPQAAVVDVAVVAHAGQVDRAQVARLVGQQRLLAAGVGAFDRAELGRGVVLVDAVDEDDAGVAVLPGQRDHRVEDLAGLERAHRLAGARD